MDTRYPQNGVHEEVLARIKEKLALYGLEVLSYTKEKKLYVPKDSELIQKLMKVYRRETKRDEKPMAIGGGTYAKEMPNCVAFGCEFPGKNHHMHEENELISLDDLLTAAAIYAQSLYNLLKK